LLGESRRSQNCRQESGKRHSQRLHWATSEELLRPMLVATFNGTYDLDHITGLPESALGQKRTWWHDRVTSALPSIADIDRRLLHVRFVPLAEVARSTRRFWVRGVPFQVSPLEGLQRYTYTKSCRASEGTHLCLRPRWSWPEPGSLRCGSTC
jgi:hypothetical protein